LLRSPPEAPSPVATRINTVISGWRSDPDFTDVDGSPAELSMTRGRQSFPALIKKYGRDVSHRAMLSEMRRMGFVRQGAGVISLQNVVATSKQPELTRLLSQGLTHIIRQAPHGAGDVINVITGEATYDVPDGASRVLLRRRLVQGTKAFAADLQAAGDASTSRRTKRPSARKVSTRILVVTVG
jgi:hypothetical protein